MECIQPDWPAPRHVKALTTTRLGGTSQGVFSGWNLGLHVGDDAEVVSQNRAILQALVGGPITWLNQVHGTQVVRLPCVESLPDADAAVTDVSGQVCTVMTADCLPVLITDRQGSQVAAVHAGWRGLLDGVIETTVAMFTDSTQCMAWLGPAIGPMHFEVGQEVYDAFTRDCPAARSAFVRQPHQKYLADLYLLAKQRLAKMGVTNVYGGDHCTYRQRDQFYSYRRDGQTGRMASCIWLTK